MLRFVLYSRTYCHLCEVMREALETELEGRRYHIDVLDVDADEAALARFDELVPVLLGATAEEGWEHICHYHLDRDALQRYLAHYESHG